MMRSTFAGFTTAFLGMTASHRALEVTGQNIANVNTEGYTRQRLDITSMNLRSGDFYNNNPNAKIGFGVDIKSVSRIRDPFLDIQYRTQMSKLGTTDAHMSGYEKLADILDETTLSGVRDALKDLNSQLQALHSNASEREYDSMVRSSAQNLLNLFHQDAQRLQEVREELANEFQDTTIKDLNNLLKNIGELNETIKNSHIVGNPALELMDQRDLLIDELSSYLPITTNYWDREIAPGVTVEVLDINFIDSQGNQYTLIADNKYGKFEADISDNKDVKLSVRDAYLEEKDITETIPNGVLKGTLDILNKSGDFDGTDVKGIGYYEKSLDNMVRELANMFNDMNKACQTNADGTVKFTYNAATTAWPPKTNSSGQWVSDTGELLYVEGTPDPVTGEPTYVVGSGTGNIVAMPVFTQGDPLYEDRPLFETTDGKDFNASNIKIADAWSNGTYGITTSKVPVIEDGKPVIGAKANENVLKMIEAFNGTREFTNPDGSVLFYKGSYYDCFTNMENVLAIDQKAADNTLTNKISVINQTADRRDSVSGVSLDEEGINLLQYQQSYTAAARLMTTLDEALDKLINGTGVVGR